MRRFVLTAVLSLFCFLSLGTYFAPTACLSDDDIPINWWVKVYPQNSYYLEVTVKVKDGECLKPSLKFYADYTDQEGVVRRLDNVFTFKEKYKVCSKTYTLYFPLKQPAKEVQDGRMYWVKFRGLFRINGMSKNS